MTREQRLEGVVPRWEWRCFGDDFGAVESVFADSTPTQVRESVEVYLLSAEGADAVKIRDGLLDVKHLEQVDADGLELWLPVLKAGFPLPAADASALAAALAVEIPTPPDGVAYSLHELLAAVDRHPDLRAVEVHKRRQHYTIGGCRAELTDVGVGEASTRTVAIESEDAARLAATVREVGLSARPNVSFVRGLRALVRFGIERFAVIDVGTNSVKFHIGERLVDGTTRTVVDRAEVTRLGEGLQPSRRLQPTPMARTIEAIIEMAAECRQQRVAGIAAVATAGMRIASNAADLVGAVKERCGVVVEIISGEDEARLAYRAATTGLAARGSLVVFDTGGGSSQFTFGHADRVDERFSVEVGAARFTEDYGLGGVVDREVLIAALDAIDADLARLDGRAPPETLVGMGGALTNLAAVRHGLADYDPDVVHGTVLDRGEIDRQIELYRARSAEERRSIVGLQPQRAEVILAGACIVRTVLGKLGKDSLTVSDRGLRHGVFAERFGAESEA